MVLLASLYAVGCHTTPPGPTPQERFAPLARAVIQIQQATAVGVSMVAFADDVRTLATEVEVATSLAKTDAERALCGQAKRTLTPYADSLALWQRKIDRGVHIRDEDLVSIATKYTQKTPETKYVPAFYNADDALQGAWAKGRTEGDLFRQQLQALK